MSIPPNRAKVIPHPLISKNKCICQSSAFNLFTKPEKTNTLIKIITQLLEKYNNKNISKNHIKIKRVE